MPQEMIEETIENGIKETKTPGKDGNIQSTLEWVSKNGTFNVRELIDDVIENGVKHTIADEFGDLLTVEDTIQNGVKDTKTSMSYQTFSVEDTIQNGVKETNPTNFAAVDEAIQNGVKDTKLGAPNNRDYFIKDTIENGVKLTNSSLQIDGSCVIENVIKEGVKYTGGIGNPNWMGNKVEDAVKNGVKHTCFAMERNQQHVDDTIQKGIKNTYSDILPKEYDWSDQFDVQEVIDNGVKHTEYGDWEDGDERLDDIIQNGVKETKELYWENTPIIDNIIENGIKETNAAFQMVYNPEDFSPELREEKRITEVTNVINNGVKEIQPLPAQDGNRDWGNYYHRQKDRTKPHTEYVNDAMSSGIKKTIWRKVENFPEYENRIIVNGVLINNSKDWGIL
jgi:predicted peroxiredoxin